MSLLNEMLKDLSEYKGNGKATLSFIARQDSVFIDKISKYAPWLLGIFIVSLLVVLISHGIGLSKRKLATTDTTVLNSSTIAVKVFDAVRLDTFAKTTTLPAKVTTSHPVQNAISSSDEVLQSRLVPIPVIHAIDNIEPVDEVINPDLNDESAKSTSINKVFSKLSGKEYHDDMLNKALFAVEAGNDTDAIRLLEHLLTKFPKSVEARESLAALYLARSQLSEAMYTLDDGLRLVPGSLTLTTMKARLLLEQDQGREAMKLLSRFNPDIHEEPDFYGLMAATLQALGRSGEAGSIYKALVQIEPSNGQYWLGYGIALEHKKATQQAVAAYKRAIQSYDVEPSVRSYAENRLKTLQG